MARNQDLTMFRGTRTQWNVAVTNSLDGTPIDLAGRELFFTAKALAGDADNAAIFQKSIGDGITVTDASGGLAQIVVAPADTEALHYDEMVYSWDLRMSTADVPETLAYGDLRIHPNITRQS